MSKLRSAILMAWSISMITPCQVRAADTYEFPEESQEEVLCRYPGEWEPEAYRMYLGYTVHDGKRNGYFDVFQWRGPRGRVVTFVGLGSPDGAGWWFGKLDGRPAAGYNLNRNHHVFSTADTKVQFECWDKGWNEHEDF